MSVLNTSTPASAPIDTQMSSLPVRRVSKWEWAVPLAAMAALLLSCAFVSAKKYYWNDEFFSYYMTTASFSKMMAAFNDKLNNTPLFYFLLGWLWDKAFGSSEISLRLFSSLGFCAALLIIWRTLRDYYNFWSTSIAVVLVTNTSYLIFVQNAEARMYGLYLFLCAIILYFYANYYRRHTISNSSLFMNMLMHAALVHTHLFGLFYSGAAFIAFLLSDRLFKVFRPKLYLSMIVGWASLVFYIPAFLIQADAGKPRTWIPAPDLRDLINIYNVGEQNFISRTLLVALVLLLVYYFFRSADKAHYFDRYRISKSEAPLLIFGLGFLLVPALVWLLSVTIKPVFWPRYMIPTAIGWIISLAYIISRNLPGARHLRNNQHNVLFPDFASKLLAVLLIGFCIWQPIMKGRAYIGKNFPGSFDLSPSAEAKYGDLPRVVVWSGELQERLHYSPRGRQYFYILDWKSAVDKYSGTFPPQEYKHMEAWKRNFPDLYRDNIITFEDFTRRYDKFLIIDRAKYWTKCPLVHRGVHDPDYIWQYCLDCPQLVNIRFSDNKTYKVTRILSKDMWFNYDDWFSLLLVEKVKEPADTTQTPLMKSTSQHLNRQLAGKTTGAAM